LAKAEAQLRKHSSASGPTGDARTSYCDPYKKNVMCGHLLQTNTDLWIDVVLSSAYSSRASHSCQIEVANPQRFRDSRFKGKICQWDLLFDTGKSPLQVFSIDPIKRVREHGASYQIGKAFAIMCGGVSEEMRALNWIVTNKDKLS